MGIYTLILDMDGVLTDFVGHFCDWVGKPNPYENGDTGWDLYSHLGMTEKEFWHRCEDRDFWALMGWADGGKELLQCAEDCFGPRVYIATRPSWSPGSYHGKAEWIQHHLPDYRDRVLMGAPKHLISNRRRILVDDNDHNIEQWVNHSDGGIGILYPRPWNELHKYSAQGLDIVIAALEKIAKEES